MDLARFGPGDKLLLRDGSRAEVLAPSEDGRSISVRYVEVPRDPALVGTETLIDGREVSAFSPAPLGPEWGERVVVVVHRVPESEEHEGGYEVVTVGGVPHGVSISAEDADSASAALDRLVAALRTFGYAGPVAVEDATYVGGVQRYEVHVDEATE